MKKQKQTGKKPWLLVRLLAFLTTFFLLLGALLLVVNWDRWNFDAFWRWMEYHSVDTTDSGQARPFFHTGGESFSLAYLNSGIVTASTTGLRYYSFSGDQYAEEIVTLKQPVLSSSRTTAVIYDAGGQDLFVCRNGEIAYHLTLKDGGDLLSARVNDDGWLVVTAQETGYKGSVTVYDNSYSQKIIQINLSSTFVVDAALSPDNKTVAVATMGQKAGSFHSQIRFYPINQKEPSHIVDLGNMAILDLDYESHQLWILGENQIAILPRGKDEAVTYFFGRSHLKGVSLGGDGFAFLQLGRYRAGPPDQALVITSEGTLAASIPLDSSTLSGDASGRYCALLAGDTLSIYTSDLTLYHEVEGIQNARYVKLTPSGAAVLANHQQVWMYLPT